MSGLRTATATTDAIYRLGGGFMISRESKVYGDEVGLPGWSPYFRGRCGVLGEVDADVVAAAVVFFPREAVREAWEAGRALPADEAALRYAQVCQDWGRRKLGGFADIERLAELLKAVVDNADVAGAPLFAGWRALPLPDDAPARVAQLTQTLRELRGGLHAIAVLASGLTPLESVLVAGAAAVGLDGPSNAAFFGWPEPYPPVTDEVRQRRDQAEELTNTLVGKAFATLDDAETDELVGLLDKTFGVGLSR